MCVRGSHNNNLVEINIVRLRVDRRITFLRLWSLVKYLELCVLVKTVAGLLSLDCMDIR